MPSSENAQARAMWEGLVASLAPKEDGSQPTIQDFRDGYEALCAQLEVPTDATYTDTTIGGVPVVEVQADGAGSDRTVLYAHGGGYVIGSAPGYKSFGAHLSRAADARVLLVDYRLAPEHPFPAAVQDATAVYRALLDQGVSPSQIVIAGDSAGGGLTVATLLALKDAGSPLPAAGVPLSPWTDIPGTGASVDANAELDPVVSREMLAMLGGLYAPGEHATHPHASPHYGDFSGLPPMLVFVGTEEVLHDDAVRLVEQASAAGVDAKLEVGEGMYHVWPCFAAFLPEARESIAKIGAFVGQHTGAGAPA
ncbi:MAG TPA: alpha/beta hydrolase [Solirubrobacteraceae bacterium]|jgi:monoterpene epsilon-lactone hydrolase|nr:alpha/beta hydrolase [Solirubrobacteraceae bacterium]